MSEPKFVTLEALEEYHKRIVEYARKRDELIFKDDVTTEKSDECESSEVEE